ncbi:MAG: phosphoglucosamine mutase [Armatimonadetes bacterium]|nr:phosphoglucosamine mutase [Armatimonadota bacterium]
MGNIFGTDGVRGVANGELLTPELILSLGRAHGHSLHSASARPRIVLGRDTRMSGEMLEAGYIAGVTSAGGTVIPAGVIPTPGVAYLTRLLGADGGAVISASHNPIGDNGIKFFDRRGFKLDDGESDGIEELFLRAADLPRPTGNEVGRLEHIQGLPSRYAGYLVEQAPRRLEGLKLVLDCAHGAACGVAGEVFERLGATVQCLHDTPDGSRINVECGSTHLGSLGEEVRRSNAHLGLAFDGDADRCLAVDEQGRTVDGDQMMLILAGWLQQLGLLRNHLVVATVMSNLGLELALRERRIQFIRTQVGDRYVLEVLREKEGVLGGEQSGHLLFLDRSTTGDGILSGIMLACALLESGRPLSELADQMERFPQKLVNVPAQHKDRLEQDSEIAAAVERLEQRMARRGRLLVRPSGTEPLVRVMAEGSDALLIEEVLSELSQLIARRLA